MQYREREDEKKIGKEENKKNEMKSRMLERHAAMDKQG